MYTEYIRLKAHCFCFRRKRTSTVEVSVTDVPWNRTAFIVSIYWNISDTISERPPSFNEICKRVYQTTGSDKLAQPSVSLVLADRESPFSSCARGRRSREDVMLVDGKNNVFFPRTCALAPRSIGTRHESSVN